KSIASTNPLPSLRFPPQADGEIDYLLVREWLATNGLGGYASGTLLGIATRRYHGLFIPNLPAPRGRTMVIPRLDEEVRSGAHAVLLGGAEFEDGHIKGDGHRYLREFRLDCLIPTWTFEIPREGAGGNHHSVLEKRIVMPHTLNTVYVEYRLISGGLMHLTLRPYVTFRMHDGPLCAPVEYPFTLAADQFIILPGSRPEENVLASISGEEVRTIVAGYHWFTDWGRDTMISLEGLTLCTGRPHEARTILLTFAHYVKDGLLPNQFPEGQRIAIYNTADATLWYFHAIDRYVERTGDRDLLKVLFPI